MLKLYDFKCEKCGHIFEKLLDHVVSAAIQCPKCQSVNVGRTWTKSNFRVHGEGAYNNKLVF